MSSQGGAFYYYHICDAGVMAELRNIVHKYYSRVVEVVLDLHFGSAPPFFFLWAKQHRGA